MYDTQNEPPRQEGRPKRPAAIFKNVGLGIGGLGVGYAGLRVGQSASELAKTWQNAGTKMTEAATQVGHTAGALHPSKLMPKAGAFADLMKKFWRGTLRSQVTKLESGHALLEFATLDYLRKHLVGEPMLARQGESGWDPGVQAEVEAAARHRQPRTAKAEKMMVAEEKKKWKPAKGYKSAPEGRDVMPDVEGFVPGTSTKSLKSGVFKQLQDIQTHKPKSEPLPPEMLHGPGGKPEFDPDVQGVKGHQPIDELWDVEEAKKSVAGKVKFKPNLKKRKRPPIPQDELERAALRKKVSAGAEAFRDPEASHLARVQTGLTPNILVKHEAKVPGEPSVRFPNLAKEGIERHRAQEIRDLLAAKGWDYRKNVLAPLRAHAREVAGLPPIQPIGKETVKRIHGAVHPNPAEEIGIPGKVSRVVPKTDVDIGGAKFSPIVIRDFQKKFGQDVDRRISYHKSEASRIRTHLDKRVKGFTSPLAQGKLIREDALDKVATAFDPGRTNPIDLASAHSIAQYTGHTPQEIFSMHKAHRRHTYLGETEAGAQTLRRQILPKTLGKIPSRIEEPVAAAGSSLLRRTAIGAGIVGGVAAGGYLVHKLRKRRQQQELKARCRLITFQEAQNVYRDPTPLHQKEIRRWLLYPESRSRALQKGLERVGRIRQDIKAPKTKTGEIIDAKGRERQPEWRKPWFKKAVYGTAIVGTALAGRHVYGKIRRAGETAAILSSRNIPLSAMSPGEQAAANLTSGHTWRAIKARFPRTTGLFTSASERGGGLVERFRQAKKQLISQGAGAVNKLSTSQIGELGKAEVFKNKSGVVEKIKWDDPAAIKENLAHAERIQKKGETIAASGIAKAERARKAGATRGTMESEMEKLRKQNQPETKTHSLLSLIRFDQDGVYVPAYTRRQVPVKEHYRSARSSQPQNKSKHYQRGFLTAAGIAGTGLGTAGGSYLVYNRWRKSAEQASRDLMEHAAKREAEIAAAGLKTVAKKTARNIIPMIKAQSRLREIRFQGQNDDRPPAWHDIATGSIEGGLGFLGTDKLLKKLSKTYPIMKKTIPRFATAVGVGGLATGTIGYGLNRLIRQKVAARKAAKQQEMSSRLKSIRFDLPQTKNQRTLVARDRYVKQIHERDIMRADRLYKNTALIGAGIGALVAKKPTGVLKAAGIGAATGVGVQKAARLYGASTRDPFGERTVNAKRVEQAPEVIGTAGLGYLALRRLQKLKKFSSRQRIVRFQEKPEKHHRLLAGALVAASGIPLYRGAGKFARAAGVLGKSRNAGHRVADYIEASQHVLNQGITGKVAGAALRNPTHPVNKWALGKGQSVIGELGTAQKGINKLSREHFSAFRSGHAHALDAWAAETVDSYEKGSLSALRSGNAKKAQNRLNEAKELRSHYGRLQGHLEDLRFKGYNEREALREAANDPRHDKLFTKMAALKAPYMKEYTKMTAGLAAVPATAGLGVAATTRKDRSRASAR